MKAEIGVLVLCGIADTPVAVSYYMGNGHTLREPFCQAAAKARTASADVETIK